MQKAFDRVNRDLLWHRMLQLGIKGRFLNACRSLYDGYKCAVRVQGQVSDLFEVGLGVKQGCKLSPALFATYIDSLTNEISENNLGTKYGQETIGMLLYADDIVLIADDEEELQRELDILSQWCQKWQLSLNTDKSQILVFRNKNIPQPDINFTCGQSILSFTDTYKYLGLCLNYNLDWEYTVKQIAASASRALGLISAKSQRFGWMDNNSFTKLYNSCVRPILEYGSELWGHRTYRTINAVYNKACRVMLSVQRQAPSLALTSETGWTHPQVRQNMNRSRLWSRLIKFPAQRMAHRIFVRCNDLAENGRLNWCKRVRCLYNDINRWDFHSIETCLRLDHHYIVKTVLNACQEKYQQEWWQSVNDDSNRQNGGNKLRHYRLFKMTLEPEKYIYAYLNRQYRRALALFRIGIAPIAIETGRYVKNQYIPPCERICPLCNRETEDEEHVLIRCPLHHNIRVELFQTAIGVAPYFNTLSDRDKTNFLLSDPTIFKETAKACNNILVNRLDILSSINSNTLSH